MRLTRILVYEGPDEWIDYVVKSHCAMIPGYDWDVSASVSDGGGGRITEVYRSITNENKNKSTGDDPRI